MDNLYEIYLEQAKLMHQNPKYWKGHMIKKYMPQIEEIIKEHNWNETLADLYAERIKQPMPVGDWDGVERKTTK